MYINNLMDELQIQYVKLLFSLIIAENGQMPHCTAWRHGTRTYYG